MIRKIKQKEKYIIYKFLIKWRFLRNDQKINKSTITKKDTEEGIKLNRPKSQNHVRKISANLRYL